MTASEPSAPSAPRRVVEPGDQRVARPHLGPEAARQPAQRAGAEAGGDRPGREGEREHAGREHARVAVPAGVDVVVVQGVEVAGDGDVHDDLRAREPVDEHLALGDGRRRRRLPALAGARARARALRGGEGRVAALGVHVDPGALDDGPVGVRQRRGHLDELEAPAPPALLLPRAGRPAAAGQHLPGRGVAVPHQALLDVERALQAGGVARPRFPGRRAPGEVGVEVVGDHGERRRGHALGEAGGAGRLDGEVARVGLPDGPAELEDRPGLDGDGERRAAAPLTPAFPPSRNSDRPVMNADASLARKMVAPTRSSGCGDPPDERRVAHLVDERIPPLAGRAAGSCRWPPARARGR